MRILVLSAYDAASHRRWRQGLVERLDEHDWQVLSLPARHFRWRIRGNSLYWARSHRDVLERDWDVVLATSMVDLSALRGMCPALASAHTVVYFHENQFAYPTTDHQHDDVSPAVVNLYTALCADRVAFNSRYNLESFLEGTRRFLERMPDFVPQGVVEDLSSRSEVLPVPLAEGCFGSHHPRSDGQPLSIVWNHRWEYDKGPERLLALVERLSAFGSPFRLHLVGRPFRRVPPALARLGEMLPAGDPRRGVWGRVEDETAYRSLLATADVVLSTALHDFQGLAILEGMAAGCLPVVPDRQAYPEWVPADYRYADGGSGDEGIAREANAAAAKIAEVADVAGIRAGARAAATPAHADVPDSAGPRALPTLRPETLAWSEQRPAWGALLERVAETRRR